MTKTRTELVHRALKNLGMLPAGFTPGAEEYSLVDALVDGMIEELQERDVVFVRDVNQIEEKHFDPLGHILANKAKAEFGAPGDQGLQAEADRAETRLYQIESQPADGRIQEGQYF